MPKKKEPNTFEMVLYYCPHCGQANLHSLEMIIANDIWNCPFCSSVLKPA